MFVAQPRHSGQMSPAIAGAETKTGTKRVPKQANLTSHTAPNFTKSLQIGRYATPLNRIIRRWALARRLRAGGRATQAALGEVGHRGAGHAGRDARLKTAVNQLKPPCAVSRVAGGSLVRRTDVVAWIRRDDADQWADADGHVLAAVRRPGHGAADAGSLRPVTRQQPG